MAAVGKKISRSNKAQINYLCQYMNSHPHFAAGDFKTPQGAAHMERQWSQLKAALDELGPHRSVEQWKVCWRDQKRKARVEGGAQNKTLNATGNRGDVPELSQNSQLILSTIGEEMALGIGPEESPIGAPPPLVPAQSPREADSEPGPSSLTPPAAAPTATLRPRRVRKVHPPDRFINAQLQMNQLMKSEKWLAQELLKEEILEKIRKLEEERQAVDLWGGECGRRKRRRVVTVSPPYVVYMLPDSAIMEDWRLARKLLNHAD